MDNFLRGRLGNQWTDDSYMHEILRRYCPDSVYREIVPDLTKFGEVTFIYEYTCLICSVSHSVRIDNFVLPFVD